MRRRRVLVSEDQDKKITEKAREAIENRTYFDLSEVFPALAVRSDVHGDRGLPQSYSERARSIATHGFKFQKEYVLYVLNKLTLEGISTDQIAFMFGVTVRTVQNWKKDLKQKFSEEAEKIDPYAFTGKTLSHYDEIAAKAWSIANDTETTAKDKVLALSQIIKSLDSKHQFLNKVGFLQKIDVSPLYKLNDDDKTIYNLQQKAFDLLKDPDTFDLEDEDVQSF